MFYQFSLSPQVKRMVIISNKDDVNELPHELLNDLRLRILPHVPHGIFSDGGGAKVPTQEKKKGS